MLLCNFYAVQAQRSSETFHVFIASMGFTEAFGRLIATPTRKIGSVDGYSTAADSGEGFRKAVLIRSYWKFRSECWFGANGTLGVLEDSKLGGDNFPCLFRIFSTGS